MGGTCPSILLQQKQGFYHQEVLHLKENKTLPPTELETWWVGFS
jgi:hypothetical protein